MLVGWLQTMVTQKKSVAARFYESLIVLHQLAFLFPRIGIQTNRAGIDSLIHSNPLSSVSMCIPKACGDRVLSSLLPKMNGVLGRVDRRRTNVNRLKTRTVRMHETGCCELDKVHKYLAFHIKRH